MATPDERGRRTSGPDQPAAASGGPLPAASGRPLADAESTTWLHALLDEFHGTERRRLLELLDSEPPQPPGSGGARLFRSRPRRRPRLSAEPGADAGERSRRVRVHVTAELEQSLSYDEMRRLAEFLAPHEADVCAMHNAVDVHLTVECETRTTARDDAAGVVCRALVALGEPPLGVYALGGGRRREE